MTKLQKKVLVGTRAAADYLNVSRSTLQRMVAKGELTSSLIGNRRKFFGADLDEYI